MPASWTSLKFNTQLEESGDPGDTAFEPGYATKVLKHFALDTDDQGDPVCTITYSLQPGHGYIVGLESKATVNVTGTGCTSNQDNLPVLSVLDAGANEANGSIGFRVTLDPAVSETVTVDYATADGTATAGSDYTTTSGTLTFEPGDDAKTVQVPLIDDEVEDSGETFTLTLSNANGATIGDGEATGTILNTESPPVDSNALTASFSGVPAEHSGESFTFRLQFSEPVGVSYATLRDEALSATGGTVTRAQRVNGSNELWEIEVEPDSDDDVTVTLAGGAACGTSGAVCTQGDDPRPLTNSPSATVAGPPEVPLTASFSDMPAEHTGESFTFGLTFSEDFGLSYQTLRDAAFSVTNGQVTRAQRQTQGSNQGWTITVEPDSHAALTVTLPAGSVETADGRGLESAVTATVAGPVGIAVADARVDEGVGAVLAFAVTLERAASGTVTVDYATSDGSAQAGVDYTAASGTLTFQAGETSKTIEVAVLDDAHDEGEETLTLSLSNPSPGRAPDGRRGDRDDREHRSAAAGADGTLRPHGGGACGRASGGASRGVPRAGLRGPVCRPGAAAGNGARRGAPCRTSTRRLGFRQHARSR